MGNFCSNCGKELKENIKFCSNCGTKINNNIASQTEQKKVVVENITKSIPKEFKIIEKENPTFQYIKNMFFSKQGRLNRKPYILLNILLLIIYLIGWYIMLASVGSRNDNVFLTLIGFVIVIPTLFSGIMLSIKRCHDLGKPGSFLLFIYVPIVGCIYIPIVLLFKKGTDGINRFGEDPLQNKLESIPNK